MIGRMLALCAGVLLAGQGLAAEPRGAVSFESLDVDRDGVITVIESKADKNVSARFSTADKNQDGYLSKAEFDAMPKS
jgi:Ca2+-binding EF-hand superfamily protein